MTTFFVEKKSQTQERLQRKKEKQSHGIITIVCLPFRQRNNDIAEENFFHTEVFNAHIQFDCTNSF